MMSDKITMTVDLTKVKVEASYTAFRATRGRRDSLGAQEEEDEPAHVEVDGVYLVTRDKAGKETASIEVSDYCDLDALEEDIENSYKNDRENDYDYDA